MLISLISLAGIQFEGEATSLNIKTTSGEITVLNNHLPLITILAPGPAKIILPNGEKKTVDTKGGFLEVNKKNQVTALVD